MEFQRFEPLASADWCALLRQRERKPLGLFVNIGFVGSVFGIQGDSKIYVSEI